MSWSWSNWKEWPLGWLWSRFAGVIGIGVVLLFFAGQVFNHAPANHQATSNSPMWVGNALAIAGVAWIIGTVIYSLIGLVIRRRSKARGDEDVPSGSPI